MPQSIYIAVTGGVAGDSRVQVIVFTTLTLQICSRLLQNAGPQQSAGRCRKFCGIKRGINTRDASVSRLI